jgi:hypothetical protein
MSNGITVDITNFYKYNIIDSCAISNILSSKRLYTTAYNAGCRFYCTKYVVYECLYKPSKKDSPTLPEMRIRIKDAMAKGDFIQNSITIEDLQEVEILQKRRKLSKGELSSMVFANKTGQAFLTDDQKARCLASTYMELNKVQTTPQLFGWLFYISVLSDSDKAEIIIEHKKMDRPLEKYFNDIYMWALECRLASNY